MKNQYTLPLADKKAELETVGGKGASLARIVNAGFPVPSGFHVTTAAYKKFMAVNNLEKAISTALEEADPLKVETLTKASVAIRDTFSQGKVSEEITKAITEAYAQMEGDDPFTAVRSSATAEDLPDLSFAGQQETFLNIKGTDEVIKAVKKCWASLWTARAIGYRLRNNIDQEVVSLAVVVQELVPADSAGVLFTANPANGRRDEMVINSVWGLGESIVGGGVTPDTYVVDKNDFSILSRAIASKDVMTTRIDGGTEDQAVPEVKRALASITDTQMVELTKIGTQIEELYGIPMDIEWTLADGKFAIVQARPITALPEPSADPPTKWETTLKGAMYMRASIIEQLPDPATPLFGTLAPKQMSKSLGELVKQVIPKLTYIMDIVGFTTINDYFYMFMKLGGGIFLRMYKDAIPAMFGGPEGGFMRWGATYWREKVLPDYRKAISKWNSTPPEDRPPAELLDGANEMLYWGTRLFTGVQLVMPVVGLSEGFFTIIYNWLIKRKKDPKASLFLLGFESHPIRAEKTLYDLAMWTMKQQSLKDILLETSTDTIADIFMSRKKLEGTTKKAWEDWKDRLQAYLDEFGHAIFNLDFFNAVVADDPRPVIETIKFYLSGKGKNPYTRQKELAKRREKITEATIKRLGPIRRRIFLKRLTWAQESAPYREDALAAVGLGWPLLREMLRELGRRFTKAGVFAENDDIYWLKADEARQLAKALNDGNKSLESFSEIIENRKMIWRGQKRAVPPQILSERKNFYTWMYKFAGPGGDEKQTGPVIKGLSIGGGVVTAPARVLHGPEDFGQMQSGDVLVASITTPAWTPLLAMASAVVTDVGGMLSHSSIVAREYGIPAVTATGVATTRIKSGQLVRVDGDAGTVTPLDDLDG